MTMTKSAAIGLKFIERHACFINERVNVDRQSGPCGGGGRSDFEQGRRGLLILGSGSEKACHGNRGGAGICCVWTAFSRISNFIGKKS